MVLELVKNRIDVGQVRLVDGGEELMRSEPMTIEQAEVLAKRIAGMLGIVFVARWEGPAE